MTDNLAKVLLGVFVLLAGVTPANSEMSKETSGGMALDARAIPFLDGLHKGYVELSRSRSGALDLIDGERFERKARQAASRVSALPDEVMDRYLRAADAAELGAALSRLRASFGHGGRYLTPAQVAKAQVAYDCWIEAAEGHRVAEMATCKRTFDLAMNAVEQVVIAWPSKNAPTALTPKSIVVLFPFDSAEISAAGRRAIAAAVDKAKAARSGIFALKITGHADRAGSEPYNLSLSLRRARAVRDSLVAGGTISSNVKVVGRGEADPAVTTGDGVRKAANRRVEILFL